MICETFKRLSLETWDQMSDARSLGFQLKEETLTDLNVIQLKKRLSTKVITHTFSKTKEGRNGADWEWWFKDSTGYYLGFRVQAKIINFKSDKYEHLYYPDNTGKQNLKLIKEAIRSNPPLIPIYCMFTHWTDPLVRTPWNCWPPPQIKDFHGCSLISAFKINTLTPGRVKDLKSLIEDLFPWHCLVCCEMFHEENEISIEKMEAWVTDYLLREKNQVLKENKIRRVKRFSTTNPPQYVNRLLNSGSGDSLENIRTPKGVYGIMIFDLIASEL
jgi:hypothetical protein